MIAVDWGSIEETFVVWRIEGLCSLREYQEAHIQSNKMISSKNYPVDIIVDIRMALPQLEHLPSLINMHRRKQAKNLGKTILLGHNDYWQRLFILLENFYPKILQEFIFTSSVDEAYLLVLPAA